MSNPEQPGVYFSDKNMADTFGPNMGGLADKFTAACDDNARTLFGEDYFPHPSTVELTPYINSVDGNVAEIVVRAQHETGIPGKSAVFQPHDTVARLTLAGGNAFLSNKDTNTSYRITPREALLLYSICRRAIDDYDQHQEEEPNSF